MKQILLFLAGAVLVSIHSNAQNAADFSWATSSAQTQSVSPPILPGCDTATRVTLTTQAVHIVNFNGSGLYSSGQPVTSALIPSSAAASSLLAFDITITFSAPVASCALLVRDIDDEYDDGNPEETLSNFSIAPSTINFVTGTYNWNGSTLTPTDNNIRFWLEWNSPPFTSVTFRYNRSIVNYAVLLDSIRFTCFNPKSVSELSPQLLPVQAYFLASQQTLQVELAADVNECEFMLFNMAGQLLHTARLRAGSHSIPLAALPSGMYIASFQSGHRSKHERFVIAN